MTHFGATNFDLANMALHRACIEQERKAIHGPVHRLCGYFVQPGMLACILDTLESVAIFDFLVRHRSQSSISNNQVHQPCYFDDLGLRSGFSYPATDCFSAVSRSSDATHTDKAVAIRHRSYLFCGRCDHTKR